MRSSPLDLNHIKTIKKFQLRIPESGLSKDLCLVSLWLQTNVMLFLCSTHTDTLGVFVKRGIVTEGVMGGGVLATSSSSYGPQRKDSAVSLKMNVPGKSAARLLGSRASLLHL
jgi:hypothetical protein